MTEKEFSALYQLHAAEAFALARRMLGDEARARDATQEIFVRLWRKGDSFKGDSSFRTWFKRLSINVCLDEIARENARHLRVSDTDDLLRYDIGHMPAEDVRVDVERAIASLPTGARIVFVLHEIEGYRYHEVAALTGLTDSTVRAHLHRARKILRGVLS